MNIEEPTASTVTSRMPRIKQFDPLEEDSITDKYRVIYEESMNPFQRFHQREETRSYHKLNVVDRTLLSTAKFFLATRTTRIIFIVYISFLHFLVISSIYEMVTWSSDSDISHSFNN